MNDEMREGLKNISCLASVFNLQNAYGDKHLLKKNARSMLINEINFIKRTVNCLHHCAACFLGSRKDLIFFFFFTDGSYHCYGKVQRLLY